MNARFLRFFFASLVGLVVDIALAWLLVRLLSIPIWLSVGMSLTFVAGLMYAIHEFWTFKDTRSALSVSRLIGIIGSTIVAFTVRILAIYLISDILGAGQHLLILQLACAAALSFVINYGLTRIVFRRSENAPI